MTDFTPVRIPVEDEKGTSASSVEPDVILLAADMIAEPTLMAAQYVMPGAAPAAQDVPSVTKDETAEADVRHEADVQPEADIVEEGAFSLWSPDTDTQTQDDIPPAVDTLPAVEETITPAEEPTREADVRHEAAPHFASPEDEDRIDVPASVPPNAAPSPATSGNNGGEPPSSGDTPAASEPQESPMTLLEHLGELRSRLTRVFIGVTICFLGCYSFAKELFYYLSLPLLKVMTADSKFIYTGVAEGFFVELKVAFVAGIFVASPYIFYQIWSFIAPGLYDEEKRYVTPLAFCSALFFLGGAAFCYLVVFPFAFVFFMSYSTDNIVAMLSINEYLSFALKMMLAFGFIFEMPLFAFFLTRMGLVTAERMRKWRKYAVLGVFIVAAILTPPDVFSQMLMAIPMLILYEFSIFVASVARRRKPVPASAGQGENA